jgi:hypothetical protein
LWRGFGLRYYPGCGASRIRARGQGRTHLQFPVAERWTFMQPELRAVGKPCMEVSLPQLSAQPNLEHLKKQAKDLLRSYQANDPVALARFRAYLPGAAAKTDPEIAALRLRGISPFSDEVTEFFAELNKE